MKINKSSLFWGVLLIAAGGLLLAQQLPLLHGIAAEDSLII
jgi:hypothetical protein